MCFTAIQTDAADLEPTTFWKHFESKQIYQRLWSLFQFYENESNSVIQTASIIGRYQGQFWAVDSAQGNKNGWENRRVFLGAEAHLFRQLTLHAQIRTTENFDPFYDGLYQALVEWEPAKTFNLAVGRLDFQYAGLERTISSTKIATFERGLLANQVMPGEVVGVSSAGKAGRFSYRAGVFSGSIEQEFTRFEGGVGAVAGVGMDLPLFYDTGGLHLDYVYNDGDPLNNAFKPYDHILALWHRGKAGPFELGLDLTWANGLDGSPAVLGATVLPTLVVATNLVRKADALQVAFRYQFATSDGDNGLRLPSRYEDRVVPKQSGDLYHAFYAGLNYLIFGDRLKLMTGVEYSVMKDHARDGGDFNGWTFLAGVRVYF